MDKLYISEKKFISLKNAKRLLNCTTSDLKRLAEQGLVEMKSVGDDIFISEEGLNKDNLTFIKATKKTDSQKSFKKGVIYQIASNALLVAASFCFIIGVSSGVLVYEKTIRSNTSYVFKYFSELQIVDNITESSSAIFSFFKPLFSDSFDVIASIPRGIRALGIKTEDVLKQSSSLTLNSVDSSITFLSSKVVNTSDKARKYIDNFLKDNSVNVESDQVVASVVASKVNGEKKLGFWGSVIDTLSDAFMPLFLEDVSVEQTFVTNEKTSQPSDYRESVSINSSVDTSKTIIERSVFSGVTQQDLLLLRQDLINLNLKTKEELEEMRRKQAYKIGDRTGDSIRDSIENISGSTITNSSANLSSLIVDTDTLVVDSENNRIGIGTSSPFATLSVDGDLALTGGIFDSNNTLGEDGYVLQTTSTGVTWVATSSLGITGGGGGVSSVDISVPTGLSVSGGPITSSGTLAINLESGYNIPLTASTTEWQNKVSSQWATSGSNVYYTGGNIGIGTSTPYAKLSVVGQVAAEYFSATSTTATSTIMGALGIGTASPTNRLSVSGNANITGTLNLGGITLKGATDRLFFGNNAGNNASLAEGSIFVGNNAGDGATNASYSNFIGTESGYQATNAFASNFLGLSSGFQATNASYSQFIGEQSGYQATNASQSVFLGPYAGYQAANAKNAIFIGYSTGASDAVNNTVSGSSILIGNFASTGGFSNSIGIGRGVANSESSQLNIGNLLFGRGIYGSDTTSGTPVSGGKIGIGTSTPNNVLDLYSTTKSALGFSGASGSNYKWTIGMDVSNGGRFSIASSTALGTTDRFVIDGNGNVGIGETSPTAKLQIKSSTSGTGSNAFRIQSAGSADRLVYRDDGRLWLGTGTASYNALLNLDSSGTQTEIQFTTTASGRTSTDGAYLMYSDSIGFRYLNMEAKPHVFYIGGSEVARFSETGAIMQITGTLAAQYSGAGSSRGGAISLISSAGTPQDWIMATAGTDNSIVNGRSWILYDNTNSVARFFVDTNGNVGAGLGSTAATARFHARSTSYPAFRGDYDASNYFTASTTSTGLTIFDAVGTAPAFSFSDNVGIGTTTPLSNAKLSLYSSASSASPVYGMYVNSFNSDGAVPGEAVGAYFKGTATGGGSSFGLKVEAGPSIFEESVGINVQADPTTGQSVGIRAYAALGTGVVGSGVTGVWGSSVSAFGKAGYFTQTEAAGYSLYVEGGKSYFQNNVGIGTTSPYAKLAVVGSVVATNYVATSSTLGFQASNLLGGATTLSTDANGNIIRTPSDQTLKDNVVTITDALSKIERLRGVTFEWKDKDRFGDQLEIGLIAQEVEEVVPEVVRSGGAYKSVNYPNLVALLIEGVKALKEKVDGILAWFEGDKFKVNGDVCVDEVCISKDQFKALLIEAQGSSVVEGEQNNSSEENNSQDETGEEDSVDTEQDPPIEDSEGGTSEEVVEEEPPQQDSGDTPAEEPLEEAEPTQTESTDSESPLE